MTEQNNNLNNFLTTVENNLAITLAEKAAALPDGFQAAKFQQNCVAMLKTLDANKLVKCTAEDVIACLMKAALLDLDFVNKECYALPYWNKDTGKNDLKFQTDYKGEDKIAKTYSIKPIKNTLKEIIRQGDEYRKIIEDGNVKFIFNPIPLNNAPIIGAFAQVLFEDGSSIGEDMNIEELESIRNNCSKAKDSPAYQNTPGEMYKKIVFRRVLKNVPKSFKNSAQQVTYANTSDYEFTQNNNNVKAPILNPFLQVKQAQPKQIEQVANTVYQPVEHVEEVPEEVPAQESVQEKQTISTEYGEVEIYRECTNCRSEITEAEEGYSKRMYGRPLCRSCQTLAKAGEL